MTEDECHAKTKIERCGLNRVARLVRFDGLRNIRCKKWLCSKSSCTWPSDVENHLARGFSADASNSNWVTDITYIRIAGGVCLYLCVVVETKRMLKLELISLNTSSGSTILNDDGN